MLIGWRACPVDRGARSSYLPGGRSWCLSGRLEMMLCAFEWLPVHLAWNHRALPQNNSILPWCDGITSGWFNHVRACTSGSIGGRPKMSVGWGAYTYSSNFQKKVTSAKWKSMASLLIQAIQNWVTNIFSQCDSFSFFPVGLASWNLSKNPPLNVVLQISYKTFPFVKTGLCIVLMVWPLEKT